MKKLIPKLIGAWFNVLTLFAPRYAGNKGFFLFSTTRRPPIKPHHLEFLTIAEQFSFDCNGDTIQGYRWGTGSKVLVFFHGWDSQTFRWKNYINAFPKDEFTIYAMDAPGHGRSTGKYCNLPIYSNAIEKFLDTIPPVHSIITHSMGSFATLFTFYRRPSLNHTVQQLIVTGSPGEATDFMTFYKRILGLSDMALGAIAKGFEENTTHLPEFYSAARFATAVTIPALIIHDTEDTSQFEAPYKYGKAIHEAIPNSIMISTTGFGHNLRSPEVVKYVADFVNGALPQQTGTSQSVLNPETISR